MKKDWEMNNLQENSQVPFAVHCLTFFVVLGLFQWLDAKTEISKPNQNKNRITVCHLHIGLKPHDLDFFKNLQPLYHR